MKIRLLGLAFVLSFQAAEKMQYFIDFNSTLKTINVLPRHLQKLLKHSNSTTMIALSRIPLSWCRAGWAVAFPNNLACIYLKLSLAIFALKLVASSLE